MHCRLGKANDAARVVLAERETGRLQQVNLDSVDRMVYSRKGNVEAEILAFTEGSAADLVMVAHSSA